MMSHNYNYIVEYTTLMFCYTFNGCRLNVIQTSLWIYESRSKLLIFSCFRKIDCPRQANFIGLVKIDH